MTIEYPSHWADMSNYLVHFTKGKGAPQSAGAHDPSYRAMLSILFSGALKPGAPFGIGRKLAPDPQTQMSVCFSEIPPGEWSRLVERRKSAFGIGFTKGHIVSCGGGPIWYVRKGSPQDAAMKKLMKAGKADPDNSIWRITPMIDAPGKYGWSTYEYEWEREWRHVGELVFEVQDVAFLFIPEALHAAARGFFQNAYEDHIGPAYFCPFLDPLWSRERVEEELAKGPVQPPSVPAVRQRRKRKA